MIWINDYLYQLLSRLKNQRGWAKVVGPYVFQKIDGKPYKTVEKTWETCCTKAGVKDARIHDIRHKALTDIVESGYSLEIAGRVAGHAEPATTKRYTHLSVSSTKDALEALSRKKIVRE